MSIPSHKHAERTTQGLGLRLDHVMGPPRTIDLAFPRPLDSLPRVPSSEAASLKRTSTPRALVCDDGGRDRRPELVRVYHVRYQPC
eukprot:4870857-Pyramimonas_sp.AAC.1